MEWNWLIFAGFILRIVWAFTDEQTTFNFTPSGKRQIIKKIFSLLVVVLVWYISFYYHADDKYQDGFQLIMVFGVYITLGWAIDSIFLAFVAFVEQKILGRLKTVKTETEVNTKTVVTETDIKQP